MPDTTQVNLAEVADKALEMGASAISELSELVKGVAPEVWEIAIRQVYADAIADFIMTTLIVVISSVLLYMGYHKWFNPLWSKEKERKSTYDMRPSWQEGAVTSCIIGVTVPAVALVISSTLWIAFGLKLIKILINPSYYAIKLLADMM